MPLKLEPGTKLVCATHNAGKAREIAALLEGRFEVVTAASLGLPEPEEVEQTFIGNAVLKARAAADACGLIAIADDSGMEVDALGGQPGIYTARWAEQADGARNFTIGMARVEREWRATGSDDSTARFVCSLSVAWPQGPVMAVQGAVKGRLSFPPRGERGFGFDPIFIPDGYDQTFGEMDPAAKHAISHRAVAFAKLKAALF